MRVAVVAEETARHAETDAAMRLRHLASLLAERGHEVRVFCSQWWEGTPDEFLDDDITYRAVTGGPDAPTRRFVRRLPRILRSFDPDVIHAAGRTPLGVLGAKAAGALSRTPVLVDWYETDDLSGWAGRAQRLAARWPDTVVTPSRLVETEVRELGRNGDLAVIPNAIDMTAIRETEPEPIADIVYSRRLDGDANVESLLLALAELRDMEWRAVVIGDGPDRPEYESQVADLRIDDRIEFLGDQPEERRIAIAKGAHVIVHTATRAPFATEFLRGLACGCVGIAEYHADSSAHELIEKRTRGFRTTSENELTDAIREASSLERKDVEEDFAEFDEGHVLEQYLGCYREMRESFGLL